MSQYWYTIVRRSVYIDSFICCSYLGIYNKYTVHAHSLGNPLLLYNFSYKSYVIGRSIRGFSSFRIGAFAMVHSERSGSPSILIRFLLTVLTGYQGFLTITKPNQNRFELSFLGFFYFVQEIEIISMCKI